MAKQNVFGGKSKKFVFLFLSMVACVLSSLGVISASIQEATPVSADAPRVERDCIGITFVDACAWSGDGNNPYLEIYSITFTSDSPYSSFDEANGHDGLEKVDNKMTYKTYLCWTNEVSTRQGYKFQLPWYIYSCSYLWKMGLNPRYWTDQVTATAGTSYVDKMTAKPDDGESRKGTLEHGTGSTDNLTSHVISADGTAVTEYAVINGTYDVGETLASSNVIQNSKYTVSKADKIGALVDYESVTYLLEGYYTNQACTDGNATQFDIGTDDTLPLYAKLVDPPVHFVHGSSSWADPHSHPKMTTTDSGTTFVYEWEVESVADNDSLFKICDYLTGSARWCGAYVSGTSKIEFPDDGYGGCNYRLTQTGTYKIVFTPSTTNFTVYCKDATANVYNVIGGSVSETPTPVVLYSGVSLSPLADPAARPGYDFTGYYFSFDEVLGVSSKWETHTFSADSTTSVYADFALISDDLSEGVYLINDSTGWTGSGSTAIPTSGKMYYKRGSGKNAAGEEASDKNNPYLYYTTVELSVGDRFYFADTEHVINDNPVVAQAFNNAASRFGSCFQKISVSVTLGGNAVSSAISCLVSGRYTITFGYYVGTATNRGLHSFSDASETASVYFLTNTASWSNVYCYMYNSRTKLPAGGSAAWPGCCEGDASYDMRVTRTAWTTTKNASSYRSYVYKVEYYPSIGSPDNLVFNDGTGTDTNDHKTKNLPLASNICYEYKKPNGGVYGGEPLSENISAGMIWLYDFDAALGNATYHGRAFTDSVCAIINDNTLATSFFERYSALADTGKRAISGEGYGILNTYTNIEEDNTTKGNVPYSTVIALLTESVGGGASARISAPGSASSPLTVTLWIVLGSGSIGIGLILGAYLVSKKKKKHRA